MDLTAPLRSKSLGVKTPGPQGPQLLGQAERPGPIRAGLGQSFTGYIISLFALPAAEETGFKGWDDELSGGHRADSG